MNKNHVGTCVELSLCTLCARCVSLCVLRSFLACRGPCVLGAVLHHVCIMCLCVLRCPQRRNHVSVLRPASPVACYTYSYSVGASRLQVPTSVALTFQRP